MVDPKNQSEQRTLRALLPSKTELIGLPVISLAFLAIINSFGFLRRVGTTDYTLLVEYIQARTKEALSYIDSVIGNTIPTLLFWMFIGIIVYVLLWLAVGTWRTWRSDLPPEGKGMITPYDYNRNRVLRTSIVHVLVRFLAALALTVWIYMLFAETLPYTSQLFIKGAVDMDLHSIYRCGLAGLMLAGWFFITSVLARCVVLRERVFN